jgi:hypothetical protein
MNHRLKEYDEWATIHEAAKLAHVIGLSKLFKAIEREWENLGYLADPRLQHQESDDEQ